MWKIEIFLKTFRNNRCCISSNLYCTRRCVQILHSSACIVFLFVHQMINKDKMIHKIWVKNAKESSRNHLPRQKAIANWRIQADKAASFSPNYWIWLALIRRSNQSWHSFALMPPGSVIRTRLSTDILYASFILV